MSTSDAGRDEAVGEPFDQTNGLAGDQLGESDGTAAGETENLAARDAEDDDRNGPQRPSRAGMTDV